MYNINLLPWREQKQALEKKQFLCVSVATLLVSLLILFVAHQILNTRCQARRVVDQYLQHVNQNLAIKNSSIKKLIIERQLLIKQVEKIEGLQASKPLTLHILDEIPKRLPSGIYLTKLKSEGGTIYLQGWALTQARVSVFIQQLTNSPWLLPPVLVQIKTDPTAVGFTCYFYLKIQEKTI